MRHDNTTEQYSHYTWHTDVHTKTYTVQDDRKDTTNEYYFRYSSVLFSQHLQRLFPTKFSPDAANIITSSFVVQKYTSVQHTTYNNSVYISELLQQLDSLLWWMTFSEKWQASCQFDLAHKLKQLKMQGNKKKMLVMGKLKSCDKKIQRKEMTITTRNLSKAHETRKSL